MNGQEMMCEEVSSGPEERTAVRDSTRRQPLIPLQLSKIPNLYFTVARVRKSMRLTDLETVFPALRSERWIRHTPMFAVATFQPTSIDCTQFTDEAQKFKDDALREFYAFFNEFKLQLFTVAKMKKKEEEDDEESKRCQEASPRGDEEERWREEDAQPAPPSDFETLEQLAEGLWINASDPPSGLPYLTQFGERGATTYDEVSGLEELGCVGRVLIATPWGPCHMATHPKFGVNMYPATFFVAGQEDTVELVAKRVSASVA